MSGPGFENCSLNVQKWTIFLYILMHIHRDINQFEAIFWYFFWHVTISYESTDSLDSIDTKLMCWSRDKIVKVRRQSERVARIRENRNEIHIKPLFRTLVVGYSLTWYRFKLTRPLPFQPDRSRSQSKAWPAGKSNFKKGTLCENDRGWVKTDFYGWIRAKLIYNPTWAIRSFGFWPRSNSNSW